LSLAPGDERGRKENAEKGAMKAVRGTHGDIRNRVLVGFIPVRALPTFRKFSDGGRVAVVLGDDG